MKTSEIQNIEALARIRIVLSRPSHPGNIGAAARAMKTMGLQRLVLVAPHAFPHAEAETLAAGADDILAAATVTTTLEEALQGTVFAVAMTARPRDLSHHAVPLRDAVKRLFDADDGAILASGEVAMVFGNETFGLSNEEIGRCNLIGMIPANPAYSSLNLAAAVQVTAYDLAQAAQAFVLPPESVRSRASHEEIEALLAHLERSMVEDQFLDPQKPRRLMLRLRRLFARAGLEKEEVAILRGILGAREKIRIVPNKA